jgi:2-keto-4-pentenoate hydratase/2-oxohepta-3-ene-1,7-dioic acid hydratase in catechol pathway
VSVSGVARQRGDTAQLSRRVPELVAYASSVMTLLPGDVLLSGGFAGEATLEPGDEISVTIDGIGTLTNKVDKGD